MDNIKSKIRTVPHWPKQGVMFRDITTLLQDTHGLRETILAFSDRYREDGIDLVAGIEARGFILGGAVAYELGVGFVPIRKKGKLPAKTVQQSYQLEYGTDTIEIHSDAIGAGKRVLLIDDLLATGGTAMAAAQLVQKLGGTIVEIACIVDLPDLGGRRRLESAGHRVFTLVEFEGD